MRRSQRAGAQAAAGAEAAPLPPPTPPRPKPKAPPKAAPTPVARQPPEPAAETAAELLPNPSPRRKRVPIASAEPAEAAEAAKAAKVAKVDCGKCVACKDKRKFGGPNLLKKACMDKRKLGEPADVWVSCDRCGKWRRLRGRAQSRRLPVSWYCELNTDVLHNSCDAPQEADDADEAADGAVAQAAVEDEEMDEADLGDIDVGSEAEASDTGCSAASSEQPEDGHVAASTASLAHTNRWRDAMSTGADGVTWRPPPLRMWRPYPTFAASRGALTDPGGVLDSLETALPGERSDARGCFWDMAEAGHAADS